MLSLKKSVSIHSASILFAMLSFLICNDISAQKFLTDTLYIELKADSIIDMDQVRIKEVRDTRNEDPRFVRYETKKKFLVIPVDQEIYTKRPLNEEILKGMKTGGGGKYNYILDIRKFEIENKKHRFSTSLYLIADIPVYEMSEENTLYLGTLYYDYLYLPLAKKESLEESTENLLENWHTDFKIDLLTIPSVMENKNKEPVQNFMVDPKIKSLYLNTLGGAFIGLDWWGIQGEIFFSRPETNVRNSYTSGIIRYQNNPDYESFALGKSSEHYSFRQNRNLLLDADLNILLGFCKWKDIEKNQPTLYQLFDIELSSVQSIIYDPLNRKGIEVRIGLIENVSYVIDKKLKFQVGLFAGVGIKL